MFRYSYLLLVCDRHINIEALASEVKHKLNILKTQDNKKNGGCELTIVTGNEFGKTVL